MRLLRTVVSTLLVCACGGASGKIDGKVTVTGGNAKGVGITAIGPTTSAGVADMSGAFELTGIADGVYVVTAHLDSASPPDTQTTVTVAHGAADMNPELTLHLPAGTATGKVIFSDGSDSSNIAVALSGTQSIVAKTDTMGAYNFTKLPSGGYSLSVDVPDSREKHQTVSFVLDTTTQMLMVPDITFTATGTLTGVIKDALGMPANQAQVRILGTGLLAVTDAMGNFELDDVPAGMRTVSVFLPGAIPEFGNQTLAVTRGMNAALMMSLMTGNGPTGTVTGAVTFWHSGFNTLIDVTAIGSGVTSQASAQGGAFSLALPPGEWDIEASAPLYPNQILAHVTVWENSTVTIPDAHMSLYRRFDLDPSITSTVIFATAEIGDSFVYAAFSANPTQWFVANARTLARRLFFVGNPNSPVPVLSRGGHYLAYNAAQVDQVIDLTSGTQLSLMRATPNSPVADFSSDESVYFRGDQGNTTGLTRYTLTSSTRKDYPGVTVKQTRDRWFVNNTSTITIVTPTMDAQVFGTTNLTNITGGSSLAPIPYAYTNCAGAPGSYTGCTLNIVPPQAMAPVQVQGTYSVPGTTLQVAAGYDYTADYFVLTTTSPTMSWKLVKIVDGTVIDLPNNTVQVDFNETGTRLAYLSTSGAMTLVHEEATPPTGTATAVATMNGAFLSGWVSPTRFIVFDNTATPRRIEVKTGVATPDTDYIANTGGISGPFAFWSTSGNMKRAAIVADSMVQVIDIPAMDGVSVCAGTEGAGPGRWGAIASTVPASFKGSFLLDAAKPAVQQLTELQVNGGLRVHTCGATHWGSSESGLILFSTGEFFSLNEPGAALAAIAQRQSDALLMTLYGGGNPISQLGLATIPFP